jgi:hypothetical protein
MLGLLWCAEGWERDVSKSEHLRAQVCFGYNHVQ